MKTINDYAELVKEKHALNKTIAPVETDLTDASRGYHIGEQFIIDGDLFKAKTEIAQHDELVLNVNYEPADDLTTQIKNAGGGTGTDPRLDVFENNIAPVETDETDASRAYQVGEQLILDNILYDVIAPISEHDVITTTGSGANIEPADPLSSQFEALTKEITDAYALMSRNGAKNHVHVTATSQTINGVTFTVNDDGSIKANGTATEFTAFDIETTATGLKAVSGNYLLSDGLANPSASHYTTITVVDKNDVTTYDYANTKDAGKQAFSIVAEDIKSIYLAVCIGANVTVNDLVFYPMVRDAEDIDSDFQPYAKTNQQLTAENQTLTNQVTGISDEIAEMTPYVRAISNPNLLDNPWFTVNQRGFASTSSAVGYTVDRWRVAYNPASNTCELTSNGMVLNSVSQILIFQQRFDEEQFKSVVGKMTTFSVLLSDGTMHKGSAIFPQKGDNSNTVVIDNDDLHVYYQYNSNSDNLPSVGIYPKVGKTVTIKAVKLELGSVSTLAQDTAPNYATELLKCQRYFVRFLKQNNSTASIAYGATENDNSLRAALPLPTTLRTKSPTISVSDLTKTRIYCNGNSHVPTNITQYKCIGHILNIKIDAASLPSYTAGEFMLNTSGDYLDISADL